MPDLTLEEWMRWYSGNQPSWRASQVWPLSCACPPGETWATIKPGKNGFVTLALLLVSCAPKPSNKSTAAQKKASLDAWRDALIDLAWVLGQPFGLAEQDYTPKRQAKGTKEASKGTKEASKGNRTGLRARRG